MSQGRPVTEEQVLYIREHFANMRNQDLAKAVGLSRSTICRVQQQFHLRKSQEHNHNMGVKAGKASSVARGGKALGITPEIVAKRVESYRRTFREERARAVFGLPQKTKIKVKKQPKRKCSQRSYLKSLGYILDEPNCVAYYTESTTRATRMERNWDKKRNYYKFRPYEDEHQQERDFLAVAGE